MCPRVDVLLVKDLELETERFLDLHFVGLLKWMVMADFGIYPQAVRNQMWSVCGGVL
jgi:hypothetical protein